MYCNGIVTSSTLTTGDSATINGLLYVTNNITFGNTQAFPKLYFKTLNGNGAYDALIGCESTSDATTAGNGYITMVGKKVYMNSELRVKNSILLNSSINGTYYYTVKGTSTYSNTFSYLIWNDSTYTNRNSTGTNSQETFTLPTNCYQIEIVSSWYASDSLSNVACSVYNKLYNGNFNARNVYQFTSTAYSTIMLVTSTTLTIPFYSVITSGLTVNWCHRIIIT